MPRTDCEHQPATTGLLALVLLLVAGCATPQYAIRPTPTPDESASALQIERTISAYQASEFERRRAQMVLPGTLIAGLNLQQTVDRLSRVTERPYLQYRVFLYQSPEPNAAALADGRTYISTGMLEYLASRGGHEDELALILGHELAHTVAQHLVKRYHQLQKQQLMMALVSLGTAVATQGQSPQTQALGGLANDAASLVNNVIVSGYSQEQELEADQLGIQYVIRAGYNPWAAIALLDDFKRFDAPGSFLRTHPYTDRRRQDLERYLTETAGMTRPAATRMVPAARVSSNEQTRAHLQRVQRTYPVGSQSWHNIQRQLDALQQQP